MAEPNIAGREGREEWRELCAAAAEERDSEKLASLVNQILRAFDERDQATRACHAKPSCSEL